MYVLIALLGVLAAVFMYVYYYQPQKEKNEALAAENKRLQTEVTRLEEHALKKAEYEAEIESMKKEINEFIVKFPADMLPEDSIMYTKWMEEENNTYVSTVNIGTPAEVVYPGQVTLMPPENVGNTDVASVADVVAMDLHMYNVPLSMSLSTTYNDFKGLVNYLYEQEHRVDIGSVSLGFDHTTGGLSGSVVLNRYYLTGSNIPYEESDIPYIDTGVDTIFGNVN